jgi:16S rRNA (guanine966-N2)-methyltransferase
MLDAIIMRVRITSGQLGGRVIKTLPTLRPMMEMARKAMFDILGNQIADAQFLDLFAGSGAAGIEALSRGAAFVTFVEKNPAHHRLIKENLATLKIADQTTTKLLDVITFIEQTPDQFDIVFAAPWYKDVADLNIVTWHRLLADGGTLIVEHLAKDPAPNNDNLEVISTRHYGDTALTFYQLR